MLKIDQEVKKEAMKAKSEAVKVIRKYQSNEYKELINNLYNEKLIDEAEKKAKLIDYTDLYLNNYGFCVIIGAYSNNIDDKMFKLKDSNGNSIKSISDKIVKELKSTREITSLPHFESIEGEDTSFNINIMIPMYKKGKEEYTEVKDYRKW